MEGSRGPHFDSVCTTVVVTIYVGTGSTVCMANIDGIQLEVSSIILVLLYVYHLF